MDSAGYITLSLFSHKILVSDFPTQNSYFVFLMKTISLILLYFDCGLPGIFFESNFRTQNFCFSPPFMGCCRRWIFFWVRFSDPKLIFLSVHHLWVAALCTDIINKPLVSFSSLISGNGATAFADDQVIWVIQVN